MDGDGGGHYEDAHEEVGHRQAHHKAVGDGAEASGGQDGQYDQRVPDDGDHNEGGKDGYQDYALPGQNQIVEVGPLGGRCRLVVVIKCGHWSRGSWFGESHCIGSIGECTSRPIGRIRIVNDGYVFRQTRSLALAQSQSQSP